MAGREVKGLVITPVMGLSIILAIAASIGGVYWRLSDKLDASRDLLITNMAADKIEKEWARAEVRRVDNQNKINYEILRQQNENYRQIIGYLQGRSGGKLLLESSPVLPPPQ